MQVVTTSALPGLLKPPASGDIPIFPYGMIWAGRFLAGRQLFLLYYFIGAAGAGECIGFCTEGQSHSQDVTQGLADLISSAMSCFTGVPSRRLQRITCSIVYHFLITALA